MKSSLSRLSLVILALSFSLTASASIVRYKFNNVVFKIDYATGLHHKLLLLDHDEIDIINSCIVQYRDRLFYVIDELGKATRISVVNHDKIEVISGCTFRYTENNTVYYAEPKTGRAYKVLFPFHNDISAQ